MHWINEYLFGSLSNTLYILVSSIVDILIVLGLNYLFFIIIILLKLIKIEHEFFEYKLRRDYIIAIIYLFIGFLISVEVIWTWSKDLEGTERGISLYIPLWISFIFCCIMGIYFALPIRKRLKEVRELKKTIN